MIGGLEVIVEDKAREQQRGRERDGGRRWSCLKRVLAVAIDMEWLDKVEGVGGDIVV